MHARLTVHIADPFDGGGTRIRIRIDGESGWLTIHPSELPRQEIDIDSTIDLLVALHDASHLPVTVPIDTPWDILDGNQVTVSLTTDDLTFRFKTHCPVPVGQAPRLQAILRAMADAARGPHADTLTAWAASFEYPLP